MQSKQNLKKRAERKFRSLQIKKKLRNMKKTWNFTKNFISLHKKTLKTKKHTLP